MNKGELISKVAKQTQITKERTKEIISETINVIRDEVEMGEKVGIVGFGTFEKVARGPKVGRNPRTGEAVQIPARNVPRFRPGLVFRKQVNGKLKVMRKPRIAKTRAVTKKKSVKLSAKRAPKRRAKRK